MCVSAKSCSTLCNHMGFSPPGSSVHGISQPKILEWVAISFSEDLPDPGTEPSSTVSSALQVNSLPLSHQGIPVYSICNVKYR